MKKLLSILIFLIALSTTTQAKNLESIRVSDLRFQDFFIEIQSGQFTQSMQNSIPINFENPEHDPEFDLHDENLCAWRSNFSDGFLIFLVDNSGSIQSITLRRSIESDNASMVDAALAIILKNLGLSTSEFVELAGKKSVVRDLWCESLNRRIILVSNGFCTSIVATKN